MLTPAAERCMQGPDVFVHARAERHGVKGYLSRFLIGS